MKSIFLTKIVFDHILSLRIGERSFVTITIVSCFPARKSALYFQIETAHNLWSKSRKQHVLRTYLELAHRAGYYTRIWKNIKGPFPSPFAKTPTYLSRQLARFARSLL